MSEYGKRAQLFMPLLFWGCGSPFSASLLSRSVVKRLNMSSELSVYHLRLEIKMNILL